MDASLPHAVVVHAMKGRARLRVDGRAGDAAFFDALAHSLLAHPHVREARASATSGSVLILHDGALDEILASVAEGGLFQVGTVSKQAPMRRARASLDALDEQIAAGTGDTLNLGKLTFGALVAAGLWQAKQGHVLPASMTVFTYALQALNWGAEREPTSFQTRSEPVSES